MVCVQTNDRVVACFAFWKFSWPFIDTEKNIQEVKKASCKTFLLLQKKRETKKIQWKQKKQKLKWMNTAKFAESKN